MSDKATALFEAGKLEEAIGALSEALRNDPSNLKARTFLFELLCFAGDLDRADKHLDFLGKAGPEAHMAVLVYRSAIHAERSRRDLFTSGSVTGRGTAEPPSGVLNGKRFETIEDADPRLGARIELFAAGQYQWFRLSDLHQVQMSAPTQLRDLLWSRVQVGTGPALEDMEMGEVLMPLMTPLAFQADDPEIRLGRATDWLEDDAGFIPIGQKLLLVDGDPFPWVEVRTLEIDPPSED